MNNQNNDSKQNQTALAVSDLNNKELQAVQMRYMGITSQEIAEATGYEESYVRCLFMRGGRLEKAYNGYASKKREESQAVVDSALEMAKNETIEAVKRLIELSKTAENEAALFKANEFILNLAGVSSDSSLRALLKNKTFDDAKKIIKDLFQDLFAKDPFGGETQIQIIHSSVCTKCAKPLDRQNADDDITPSPTLISGLMRRVKKDDSGTPSNP